jgi:hypothetical protein
MLKEELQNHRVHISKLENEIQILGKQKQLKQLEAKMKE